jgi:transposase-like protein
MKLSYEQLWLLLQCWQQKVSFGTTMEITGVSAITVRRWFRRFRAHLVYESPSLRTFVEVDEAFLGRRRYGNQRIVLGAYERNTGAVVLRAVPNREQETTDRFLLKHIHAGSTIATDSATCYDGIDTFFGFQREVCNHSQFHFGPTNHIESVWSALKRFIRRTYHHYHKYWLPALLREFEARINAPRMFESPLTFLQTCLTVVPSG